MNDKKYWLHPHSFPFMHRRKKRQHYYEPFYDAHSDYNTNAPSYYDYLARFNSNPRIIIDLINRLLRRDILLEDTNSIDFTKIGSWIEDECDNFDDEITLKANVKISKQTETVTFKNLGTFTLNNGSKIKSDGVWSADYGHVLRKIDDEIKNIYKEINNINKRIDGMMGINKQPLVKGKDYTIQFFNDYYTKANDLDISVIETDNTLEIFIQTSKLNETILLNDTFKTSAEMLHANPLDEVPKSRIFAIEFLGEYAKYNNKSVLQTNLSNNLWNVAPTSARASWTASLSLFRRDNKYLFTWTSYSDGYNSQLSRYDEDVRLTYGSLRSSFTIRK